MRRILKFPLQPDVTEIRTADEPRFLAVGWQGKDLVAWVEATVGEAVATPVAVVNTGEEAPPDSLYVGTAQLDLPFGTLVAHVYRLLAT